MMLIPVTGRADQNLQVKQIGTAGYTQPVLNG